MSRLPIPGADSGTWGSVLNDYLSQSHKADGTLKDNSVGNAQIQDNTITSTAIADGTITEESLTPDVKAKLNSGGVSSIATLSGTITSTALVNALSPDLKAHYAPVAGRNLTASAYSWAEGDGTTASGSASHAEGSSTIASENISHAEGILTKARGNASHAEGLITTASGDTSHAEGTIDEIIYIDTFFDDLDTSSLDHPDSPQKREQTLAENILGLETSASRILCLLGQWHTQADPVQLDTITHRSALYRIRQIKQNTPFVHMIYRKGQVRNDGRILDLPERTDVLHDYEIRALSGLDFDIHIPQAHPTRLAEDF